MLPRGEGFKTITTLELLRAEQCECVCVSKYVTVYADEVCVVTLISRYVYVVLSLCEHVQNFVTTHSRKTTIS